MTRCACGHPKWMHRRPLWLWRRYWTSSWLDWPCRGANVNGLRHHRRCVCRGWRP